MAINQFEGAEKRIALWGAIGIVGAIIGKAPIAFVAGAILWGILLGAICSYWLLKRLDQHVRTTSITGILVMIGCLILLDTPFSYLASFALGSLYLASMDLSFFLLGRKAWAKANQPYQRFESIVEKLKKGRAERDALDPTETRNSFLTLLPQPLQEEMRQGFVPVIGFRTFRSLESLPQEASSLGGHPLLSTDQSWPMRKGQPLEYLTQINLAELAAFQATPLPSQGILSFFYDKEQPWGSDPEDLGSGVVLYSPFPAECKPVSLREKPSTLRQPIQFHHHTGLCISDQTEARFYEYFRSLAPDAKQELDHLHDLVMEQTACDLRVLSAPARVQNDMDNELKIAALAYGLPENTQWTMLLQLDSEHGWCWGDAGCIYFWVPTQDLASPRFDRVWVVQQCS